MAVVKAVVLSIVVSIAIMAAGHTYFYFFG